MMTFALTLLVLLSPGDEPMATAIAAAARATLGADTALELRFLAVAPNDAAALALAHDSGSAAIALITWTDSGHQRARLRVYSQTTRAWTARDLDFAARDPAEEKGRAIGFNLASMLPEGVPFAKRSLAPAAPPAPSAPTTPPAPRVATLDTAPAPVAKTAPVPPNAATPRPWPPWTLSIDAAAQGVVAVSGEGTSVGGALGGQYRLDEHLSLSLGAALRIGHIEALEARLVTVDFGPGVAWRSGDLDAGRRWGLQLQLGAFARLQSLRRTSAGSQPRESHGRFVPGAGIGVELTYALTRDIALLANIRVNAVLGQTDVFLRDREVAAFAPIELGLGLGARTYF